MLKQRQYLSSDQAPNLLFMRRRQAADLLLSLAESRSQSIPERNLLLDALYQLPTECFIADDWSTILNQITHTLLLQEEKNGAWMPTHLSSLLAKVKQRLNHPVH